MSQIPCNLTQVFRQSAHFLHLSFGGLCGGKAEPGQGSGLNVMADEMCVFFQKPLRKNVADQKQAVN